MNPKQTTLITLIMLLTGLSLMIMMLVACAEGNSSESAYPSSSDLTPLPPSALSRTPLPSTPTVQPSGLSSKAEITTTGRALDTSTLPVGQRPGSIIRGADGITVTLPIDTRVSIPVGQRIYVLGPMSDTGWNVEFDATRLEVAHGIDVSTPPPTGWIWIARRSGPTEIRFVSRLPACDEKSQPCPGGIPSFMTVLLLDISQ
jgi:hypothetical protein